MNVINIKGSNKKIGADQPVFFIAEIGKNFIQTKEDKTVEEYLDNAKKLIKEAKDAGADAVKLQTHNLEDEFLNIDVVSPHFKGSDRYNWIGRNQKATPLVFWQEIKKYCDDLGIIFFSTPMSRGAAQILNEVDIPMWKVGSGDLLDFVMLDYIAQTGKPIIISTGMSTLEEVDKVVGFLKKRTDKIIILHCVSKYPCPPAELNLNSIKFLQEKYGLITGFSDHSVEDYNAVLGAVEIGAKVIEKHFSLSRDLWGSDHKASLVPEEFGAMVEAVKSGDKSNIVDFGSEDKLLSCGEEVFRPIFRKSLVAGRDIEAGETITADMVYAMRPQQYIEGLPSEEYEVVIGKKARADIPKYSGIGLDKIA